MTSYNYHDRITNKPMETNPNGTILSKECWRFCHMDCYDSELMCRCWCHHKHGYAARQKLKHAKEPEAMAKLF